MEIGRRPENDDHDRRQIDKGVIAAIRRFFKDRKMATENEPILKTIIQEEQTINQYVEQRTALATERLIDLLPEQPGDLTIIAIDRYPDHKRYIVLPYTDSEDLKPRDRPCAIYANNIYGSAEQKGAKHVKDSEILQDYYAYLGTFKDANLMFQTDMSQYDIDNDPIILFGVMQDVTITKSRVIEDGDSLHMESGLIEESILNPKVVEILKLMRRHRA